MSSQREISLAEYVAALGNSNHRAANEYIQLIERVKEMEAQLEALQKTGPFPKTGSI